MTLNITKETPPEAPFMDADMKATYFIILDVQTKILPAICVLGFVTNFLSLLVFLQPSLKRLSCSVYLAAKAITDFLFLLTVLVIWLPRIDVNIFHYAGICQIVVFLSYLTAFISIWLAVALTVENLLCVVKPWYVQRSCNTCSAITTTFTIIFLGVMLYHFSLWNNGVRYTQKSLDAFNNVSKEITHTDYVVSTYQNKTPVEDNIYGSKNQYNFQQIYVVVKNITPGDIFINKTQPPSKNICMPLEEFSHLIVAMTYVDSLITLFIPLIILAVDNAVIVVLAVRASKGRIQLRDQKRHYHLPGTHLSNQGKSSTSLKSQASRFLFAVSMTTLLFHLPSHMIRLRSLVFGYTGMDILIQRVFETLYYTHYAIGFFVYILFGKNFRRVFLRLVTRRCSRQ